MRISGYWNIVNGCGALVLLAACGEAQIPFRSEVQVTVDYISAQPTPEPTPEPTPSPSPTPTPKPKATQSPKKSPPKPIMVDAKPDMPNEHMINQIERMIGDWQKRKVTREDLESQIPVLATFEQKAKNAGKDEVVKIFDETKKALGEFKIDSLFISKKIERTLLILNRSKLPAEKYAAFQNRIERLEKPISEEKYMLANEELTVLQDEISDAVKFENLLQ